MPELDSWSFRTSLDLSFSFEDSFRLPNTLNGITNFQRQLPAQCQFPDQESSEIEPRSLPSQDSDEAYKLWEDEYEEKKGPSRDAAYSNPQNSSKYHQSRRPNRPRPKALDLGFRGARSHGIPKLSPSPRKTYLNRNQRRGEGQGRDFRNAAKSPLSPKKHQYSASVPSIPSQSDLRFHACQIDPNYRLSTETNLDNLEASGTQTVVSENPLPLALTLPRIKPQHRRHADPENLAVPPINSRSPETNFPEGNDIISPLMEDHTYTRNHNKTPKTIQKPALIRHPPRTTTPTTRQFFSETKNTRPTKLHTSKKPPNETLTTKSPPPNPKIELDDTRISDFLNDFEPIQTVKIIRPAKKPIMVHIRTSPPPPPPRNSNPARPPPRPPVRDQKWDANATVHTRGKSLQVPNFWDGTANPHDPLNTPAAPPPPPYERRLYVFPPAISSPSLSSLALNKSSISKSPPSIQGSITARALPDFSHAHARTMSAQEAGTGGKKTRGLRGALKIMRRSKRDSWADRTLMQVGSPYFVRMENSSSFF